MRINNITFTMQDYGQEFSFTDSTGNWHSAVLQLPNTPDSQHRIDGEEWVRGEDANKDAICGALRGYFYNQFKSLEHGKASIAAGFSVTHLVECGWFHVAFSAEKAVVLKEGAASSYYNVFCFELAFQHGDEGDNESEIIERATKKLYLELSASLKKKCDDFATSANFEGNDKATIEQCFDEITADFMRSEFDTVDYSDADIAGTFYQSHACDIRSDAARNIFERA